MDENIIIFLKIKLLLEQWRVWKDKFINASYLKITS